MELYKDKEISDTVTTLIDPNEGIEIKGGISIEDFHPVGTGTVKSQAFKEHKSKSANSKSDLEDLDLYKHPLEDEQDSMAIDGIGDFDQELISIEELIEYLDNTEKQIDV